MILLSLNIRGIGGALKSVMFRRVLDHIHPDIIFLQENLVEDSKAGDFIQVFRPNWVSCAVSSLGTSWGLLVSWDTNTYSLIPTLTCGGIFLIGRVLSSHFPITFLNVYGLCIEKRNFGDILANSGILEAENLIMVGDLNITLSAEEMWGSYNFSVYLADHLIALFQSKNLVDICPDRMVPTWRNGRQGSQDIAKILDQCLILDSLLISKEFYRSWVEYPYISDHGLSFFRWI